MLDALLSRFSSFHLFIFTRDQILGPAPGGSPRVQGGGHGDRIKAGMKGINSAS
jgi:hypothetical protein